MIAFQDCYPNEFAHCYGCGRLNPEGHHLRSFWEGEQSVARFTPKPYHTAIPGFVSGGILASLVDCHGTGTAAAAVERAAGRELGTRPLRRFVTASLRVDYVRPTPLGPELEIRGIPTVLSDRKVSVAVTVSAGGAATVRGEVVCVELPESMRAAPQGSGSAVSSTGGRS